MPATSQAVQPALLAPSMRLGHHRAATCDHSELWRAVLGALAAAGRALLSHVECLGTMHHGAAWGQCLSCILPQGPPSFRLKPRHTGCLGDVWIPDARTGGFVHVSCMQDLQFLDWKYHWWILSGSSVASQWGVAPFSSNSWGVAPFSSNSRLFLSCT